MDKVKEILLKILNAIKNFFIKLKDRIKKIIVKIKEKHILKKIKTSIIKFFGFIGSSVGSLIHRKKDVKKELDSISKEKGNIEKNLYKESDIVVIKAYKKEVNKMIKKLDKLVVSDREEEKNIQNKKSEITLLKSEIEKVESKLNNTESVNDLDVPSFTKEKPGLKKVKNISKTTGKTIKKGSVKVGKTVKKGSITVGKTVKKGTVKTAKVIGKGGKKTGVFIVGSIGAIVSNIRTKIKTKKKKKQEYKNLKNNIKEVNLKINRAYKEISKIKNSYSDTKLQELLFVKEKVLDLKEDYIRLRSAKNFKKLKADKKIDNIDPNHLSHHGNAIYDLIDYIELSINEIKEGRITKEPKVLEEVKEPVIKKEKVITFDANDFILVKESIDKDINSSLQDIVKIKNEINDIPFKYKKSRLLNRICGFFKFSMNTAISLIPFGIFKNKFVATLTSGIILNNRMKAMRSLIYDKRVEFIDYESIINNINDKESCLKSTGYVLLDTVEQIELVSKKLMEDYSNNPEALKLVKNLEEMKLDLLEENTKIETVVSDLEKNKVKVKIS